MFLEGTMNSIIIIIIIIRVDERKYDSLIDPDNENRNVFGIG